MEGLLGLKSTIARSAARVGIGLSFRRPQALAAPHIRPAGPQHDQLANDILSFFERVRPFYDASVAPPLRIAGAWRADLLARRTTQLQAIETRNIAVYASLLAQLFRSELVLGMWNYGYYAPRQIVRAEVYADLADLALETGRSADDIASVETDLGEWGLQVTAGIVKNTDPWHASQASGILRALRVIGTAHPTLLDIGSGYGGLARYLARWGPRPLTVILIDIPLNLTTAYAYLAHRVPDADVRLISSSEELQADAQKGRSSDLRIMCVPTILGAEATHLYPPHLVHNAASFSEMDAETVHYYLTTFVRPETRIVVETNAGIAGTLNTGNHRELGMRDIESMLDPAFYALSRHRVRGTRYVTSTYVRTTPPSR
jgi:hypothetical protein